jgi:hypothetical protein
MSEYRDYEDQFSFADRNFRIGDRVVFVGPPADHEQPSMISRASEHVLYRRSGRIAYGPSESLRCYPEESVNSDLGRMVWVEFEGDTRPIRQVDALWLLKAKDV